MVERRREPARSQGPPGGAKDPYEDDSRPGGIEVACRQHLEFVRKHCPDLIPSGPVPPGESVDPIPVDTKQATGLVRAAVARVAAGGRSEAGERPRAVLWRDGTDSLLVLLDSVRVTTRDGLVTVAIDVACDQLDAETGEPRGLVEVDLVVGTGERPTGMLAAAPLPRGPAVVVDRWHDALVALAWQALLDTTAGLSAAAGSDPDGSPLVPTAWSSSADGLAIRAQARHPFDRRLATSQRVAASPVSAQEQRR